MFLFCGHASQGMYEMSNNYQ
uniref:Uncharacterized protein n=1 Tax=Anguilla anguilla TaxID=7936 RepID=A0A0E9Q2H5_ANGAN